ncbi:MAG: thioredoxin family protein [Desulfobulbaceae bacterium]|nr:thioredoxin family protein [Desulfobulbaceae bacterium]
MSDTPIQRQLRVGRATVGLLGLDIVLNQLLGKAGLGYEEAVTQLYEEISKQNYIPAGMEEQYRQALGREYERLRSGQEASEQDLVIRVLGPGCVSCNNLQNIVIEVMSEMGIAADVFQVHDLDEIGRFGIIQTPALLINGKVKCAGRLPTSSQIEEWLRDFIDGVAGPA